MNYNIAMNRKEQKEMNEIQEQTTNKDGLPNAGDIGRSSGNQKITHVTKDRRSYTEVDQNVENLM